MKLYGLIKDDFYVCHLKNFQAPHTYTHIYIILFVFYEETIFFFLICESYFTIIFFHYIYY